MNAAPRHCAMMCRVERLEYNFCSRSAVVHLVAGHCVDMEGTIEAMRKVDAGVRHILTVADGVPDVAYVLIDGAWCAIPAAPFAWRPDPQFQRRPLFEKSC